MCDAFGVGNSDPFAVPATFPECRLLISREWPGNQDRPGQCVVGALRSALPARSLCGTIPRHCTAAKRQA
jgi:hypothetical protein